MWKFKKLTMSSSPIAQLLHLATNRRNIVLAVYNLDANRVDCAAMAPNDVRGLSLDASTVSALRGCSRGSYVILAYDKGNHTVYKIEEVPELNAASAVLLCIVTELLGGNVAVARGGHEEYRPEYEDYGRDEDDDDFVGDEDEGEDDFNFIGETHKCGCDEVIGGRRFSLKGNRW